ncbi:MAG: hypothetical protein ACPMAG_01355 [Limisphaerales bacterium]
MTELKANSISTGKRVDPIAFLTDAPPYLDGGHGCHVLSFNLISALKQHIRIVITRRMRRSVSLSKIRDSLHCKTLFYPDLSLLPSFRFLSRIKSYAEISLFQIWIRRAADEIINSGAKRIFACCGADPFFLWVVEFVRRYSKLPVDLYLVDDFESSAILNGMEDFAKTVADWERKILPKADRVFTISKGFAEHIQKKLGLENCQWLPIPILTAEQGLKYKPLTSNIERPISYFGAVNPLYVEEIRVLIDQIRSLNRKSIKLHNSKQKISNYGIEWTPTRLVIMSYTEPEVVFRELGEPTDYIFLHRADSEQCRKIMGESLAIFMPYTFRSDLRTMVSTSFPSRLAETIKIGRPLFVYGPDYASLPRYFIENQLDIVVTDKLQLSSALRDIHKFDNPETISRYESVILKYHSSEALGNILAL